MTDELLLGVDVGTASTKGVLTTPLGEVIAAHEIPHELSVPRPGWAEHDAEQSWWGDFVTICGTLLASGRGDAVRAVGVSGIGPCFCPADDAGRALRPAILYGIDTRATAEIADLDVALGRAAILHRTGSVLTSQAVGPKLLWFRRHEAELFARTRYVLPASSFLVLRLTGEYVVDRHTASGFNPMYDIHEGAWIDEWCATVLGEHGPALPRPLWAVEQAGEVSAAAAAETGLRAGTPVAAGTVDAAAEAFSVGVRKPGELMLMYGSTFFLILVVDRPRPDGRLWGTSYVLPGTANIAAGTATSGSATAWFRSLLGRAHDAPGFGELAAEAAEAAPGSGGLVVLPYLSGERTPIHDPLARGLVAGLTLGHGRGELYRAILEGTAYGVRHILEAVAELDVPVSRVVAVGGGVRGGLWPQIVSDVVRLEQELPVVTIGASYGDTLLAGLASGLVWPGTVWERRAELVVPDSERAARYDELYPLYRSLYEGTRAEMHALAAFAGDGDRLFSNPAQSQ
jgi:xylulokinase